PAQSTRTKCAPQYGQSAWPPSDSIGRYTRGCEFHSAIDGSGQLSGRSARRTWYSRSALAGRGWVWVAVMSARGMESDDILARKAHTPCAPPSGGRRPAVDRAAAGHQPAAGASSAATTASVVMR